MNVEFNSNHMATLIDLYNLAQKHNCVINFGTDSSFERELDYDILEKSGFSKSVIEELQNLDDDEDITDKHTLVDKIWFELYNKTDETYHSMAYIENTTFFSTSLDTYRISDELFETLCNHDIHGGIDSGEYFINEVYCPTVIYGFGNKEKVQDFRCYRNGMALKFFVDLVCEYLNEPYIKRNY